MIFVGLEFLEVALASAVMQYNEGISGKFPRSGKEIGEVEASQSNS